MESKNIDKYTVNLNKHWMSIIIVTKALTEVMKKDGTKILETIICEKRRRMIRDEAS